jgi:hypothetical protein
MVYLESMSEESYENLEQKAKDLAITSMAISISCIFMTAGLLSFIGSIIGHIALGKLKSAGNTSHTGFAIAGIVIGYVATALSMLVVIGLLVALSLAFI